MAEQYKIIDGDRRNLSEAEQNWDYALTFNRESTNKRLFKVFSELFDLADDDITEVYNTQHINSTSGGDLDKFGDLINVDRKSGEINSDEYIYGFPFGDTLKDGESFTVKKNKKYFIQQDITINGLLTVNGEVLSQSSFTGTGVINGTGAISGDREDVFSEDKYRARIKATFRASTMGTTYDQFVEFCSNVLSTSFENIEFITLYDANPAVITVRAPERVFNDIGFTPSNIDSLLGKGVPAGHTVNTEISGTFEVKPDGAEDDPDKGLTADNIETGGTLLEDLV
jgi:hypothetical protein